MEGGDRTPVVGANQLLGAPAPPCVCPPAPRAEGWCRGHFEARSTAPPEAPPADRGSGVDLSTALQGPAEGELVRVLEVAAHGQAAGDAGDPHVKVRSEEHTSELQSLMRISYAVFC